MDGSELVSRVGDKRCEHCRALRQCRRIKPISLSICFKRQPQHFLAVWPYICDLGLERSDWYRQLLVGEARGLGSQLRRRWASTHKAETLCNARKGAIGVWARLGRFEAFDELQFYGC
jgi:hypothetical protein